MSGLPASGCGDTGCCCIACQLLGVEFGHGIFGHAAQLDRATTEISVRRGRPALVLPASRQG